MGIPCRQVVLSGKLIGGDFKFRDYYSCLDREPDPFELKGTESEHELLEITRLANPKLVALRQRSILEVFQDFVDSL